MLSLSLPASGGLRLLCLGAHPDDIEIGCGGTLLRLRAEMPDVEVRWIVFSGTEERRNEARRSAELFLAGCTYQLSLHRFRDSLFPFDGEGIKEVFEAVKREFDPSLILTHWRGDAHQDHRLIGEFTHNTFRDHLILEYEIPKYDGDFGSPNLFVPLSRDQAARKADMIVANFASQRSRRWFDRETFLALARLRGMTCNAPGDMAEAFYATRVVI